MGQTYRLSGCALVSDRDDASGEPINFQDVGEVSDISISLEKENVTARSTCEPLASISDRATVFVGASGIMTVKSRVAEALEMAFFGAASVITGGVFTDVDFSGPDVEIGQQRRIPGNRVGLTALTVEDSTDAALVLDTDFEANLEHGLFKLLTAQANQPLKVTGTERSNQKAVSLLTKRVAEKWIRFPGANNLNGDKAITFDMFRCQIDAADAIPIKESGSEEDSGFEIPFTLLKDPNRTGDLVLGDYGAWIEQP